MKVSHRIAAILSGSAIVCGSLVAIGGSASAVLAAPSARVVPDSVLGSVRSGHAIRTGAVPATTSIRFQVALQIPHFAAEKAFVASLGDRDSPNFHNFLTPAEATARFGPTAADQQTVISWLQTHGFTVDKAYPDRLLLDVTGTAHELDAAFKVDLSMYRQPGTRSFYAGARNPTIPAPLSAFVQNVISDNYLAGHSDAIPLGLMRHSGHVRVAAVRDGAGSHANGNPKVYRAMLHQSALGASNRPSARRGYTCEPDSSHCYIDDPDLWSTDGYDVQALKRQGHCCNPLDNPTTGTPVDTSIDIVGACGFNFSDVDAFFTHYGMAYNYTVENVNGGPSANTNCANSSSGGGLETTLDVEQAVAMSNDYGAYQATPHVYVYLSPADGILRTVAPRWRREQSLTCGMPPTRATRLG